MMVDLFDTEMCVYKLTHRDTGAGYVGQSTGPLRNRVNQSHQVVRTCGGLDNFDVSVLECANDKDELTILETKHILQENTLMPHGMNRTLPNFKSSSENLMSRSRKIYSLSNVCEKDLVEEFYRRKDIQADFLTDKQTHRHRIYKCIELQGFYLEWLNTCSLTTGDGEKVTQEQVIGVAIMILYWIIRFHSDED